MDHRPNTIDLNDLLLGGWKWIVSAAIVCGLLGVILGTAWPKSYEATAVLTIEPSLGAEPRSMETEQVVASSTAVQSRAAEELDVSTGQVGSIVSVQVPQDAFALEFTATHPSPQLAAEFANAMADAYGDQSQERVMEATTSRIEALVALTDELEEELAAADEDSARAAAVQSRLAAAEQELLDLEVSPETGASARGTLVSPAFPPTTPATPGLPLFAAGGLVAGLIIGVGLVVVLHGHRPDKD